MNKLLTSLEIRENHEMHGLYPIVTGSNRLYQRVGEQETSTD